MSFVKQNRRIDFNLIESSLNLSNQAAKPDSNKAASPHLIIAQFSRYFLDIILIFGAFLISYYLRYNLLDFTGDATQFAPVSLPDYMAIGTIYTCTLFCVLNFKSYYKKNRSTSFWAEFVLISNSVLIATALVTLLMLLFKPDFYFSRMLFIFLVPVSMAFLGAERGVTRNIYYQLWRRGVGARNLVVVGATDAGVWMMRNAVQKAGLGYKLVGYVDDEIRFSDWTLPVRYGSSIKRANREVPHLGSTVDLANLIQKYKVDEVVIALPLENYEMVNQVITQCRQYNLTFTLVPDLLDLKMGGVSVREINGIPLITSTNKKLSGTKYALKRALDIFLTLGLIGVAALPMIVVSLLVKLDSHGPVIFKQTRVGKNGKTFTFYKFRSMYINADLRLAELEKLNETNGATFKMKNDPRITPVGRFIRRTSLDELPQLFNVLLGDMSLVGPRPGLPREVVCYQPWQHRRLEVLPGLTGLWQVNGRSSTSFVEMVKLDIYYIEHWSPMLDLKILFKTVCAVLKCDGAY